MHVNRLYDFNLDFTVLPLKYSLEQLCRFDLASKDLGANIEMK